MGINSTMFCDMVYTQMVDESSKIHVCMGKAVKYMVSVRDSNYIIYGWFERVITHKDGQLMLTEMELASIMFRRM